MRTVLLGGAIVATVLTLGPGASVFILEPAFETAIRYQRQEEKKDKKDLEKIFRRQSAKGQKTKDIDSAFLWDNNVKEFEDLDRYSIKDQRDEELRKIVQQGGTVGFATIEATKDVQDSTKSGLKPCSLSIRTTKTRTTRTQASVTMKIGESSGFDGDILAVQRMLVGKGMKRAKFKMKLNPPSKTIYCCGV